MVELIAIVRRDRALATKAELTRIGCAGYSWFPVLGRGRQGGLQSNQALPGFSFLPKALFTVIVEKAHTDETIEAIIRANQTGEFGDGKLFVLEVVETHRISTGDRSRASTSLSTILSERSEWKDRIHEAD
jgi:nitrogen regulatory protein PII